MLFIFAKLGTNLLGNKELLKMIDGKKKKKKKKKKKQNKKKKKKNKKKKKKKTRKGYPVPGILFDLTFIIL